MPFPLKPFHHCCLNNMIRIELIQYISKITQYDIYLFFLFFLPSHSHSEQIEIPHSQNFCVKWVIFKFKMSGRAGKREWFLLEKKERKRGEACERHMCWHQLCGFKMKENEGLRMEELLGCHPSICWCRWRIQTNMKLY